jgi:hypothetical protein
MPEARPGSVIRAGRPFMPSTSGFGNANRAAGNAGHAFFRARACLSALACPGISTPERRARANVRRQCHWPSIWVHAEDRLWQSRAC